MISRFSPKRRAVTLTELLVVLAIISLLATIAVPVYLQKSEQARVAIARQEVREIADAEQQVFALYGYFVPIHILDNVPDLPTGQTTSAPRDDFAHDNYRGQEFLIDPLGNLQNQITGGPSGSDQQRTLSTTDVALHARVRRLIENWAGPFLNAQRKQTGYGDQGGLISGGGTTQEQVTRALVLDPWGRPYRMYSPIGIVGNDGNLTTVPAPSQISLLYDLTYDNGHLTVSDQRFDRWAIVSFGRDGLSDSYNGKYTSTVSQNVLDDIFYTFGVTAGESFYRAF